MSATKDRTSASGGMSTTNNTDDIVQDVLTDRTDNEETRETPWVARIRIPEHGPAGTDKDEKVKAVPDGAHTCSCPLCGAPWWRHGQEYADGCSHLRFELCLEEFDSAHREATDLGPIMDLMANSDVPPVTHLVLHTNYSHCPFTFGKCTYALGFDGAGDTADR